MDWTDEALILGGRRFGESGLILDVLTKTRGRRAGLVYGGASRRKRAQLEAGNTLEVAWSGRLEEQLGRFDVAEALTERASRHLDDADALGVIAALTAILRDAVEEGDAAGSALYEASTLVLDALDDREIWPALYVRWEAGLLSALGYGMDLSACAVSGANDGLTHVSPRTGRAVKGSEAEDYLDRLLTLPSFLIDPSAPIAPPDVAAGLTLTGHFLERRLYAGLHKPPPEARDRLITRLERSGLADFTD
ncbi:MAG: DNA repair protein RecO [Pseudomonadota bacterium]